MIPNWTELIKFSTKNEYFNSLIYRRFSIIYGLALVVLCLGPFLIESMKYIIPIQIPYLNNEDILVYTLNYLIQTCVIILCETIMSATLLSFIVFTKHLITKLKWLGMVSEMVGQDAENKRMNNLLCELNSLEESEDRKKDNLEEVSRLFNLDKDFFEKTKDERFDSEMLLTKIATDHAELLR